jgi:leader peptidase (prepilin peptidase)/N-methyltransferase
LSSLPDLHLTEITVATIIAAPVVGSFLGVVIERLPAGRPFVWGRSVCDACGHELGALDLIPFASWLLTRGRCSYCRAKLSVFYPLIELAALLVAAWAATAASGLWFLASCVPGWALLVVAAIDWRKRRRYAVPALAAVVWLAWLYLPAALMR